MLKVRLPLLTPQFLADKVSAEEMIRLVVNSLLRREINFTDYLICPSVRPLYVGFEDLDFISQNIDYYI